MRNLMSDVAAILDRDVFQCQLAAVADEMSAAIRRAAFSPIIWDMLDYSCALFAPNGEMLAQAETIPAQLGVMSYALAGIGREVPISTWRPGDVVICNDPYRGCTHTPDIVLFSPIFADDELVAISAVVAHHVDIGGKLPSTTAPDNVEVFAEGLIFPPMKLISEGERNETAFAFISANVRNPRACIGDLNAQIAGCRTGEKRVVTLVERYGIERFRQLSTDCLAYGERYIRNALRELPNGVYSAEILMEDDVSSFEPIRLKFAVEIREYSMHIDFTGSDRQRANALNCPLSSTYSMALYAVRCLTGAEHLHNGGCTRPIEISVPEGSLLNPRRPAAVGNRHFSQQAVAELVLKALAHLAPRRASAGCHISFPSMRAGGFDRRPETAKKYGDARYFIMHDILGGGMGGFAGSDGMNAVDTHGGNCGTLSAEIIESAGPIRILRTELIPGSGGEGQYRGGLGMLREYEVLAEETLVSVFYQQGSLATAAWGANGGRHGRPARAVLNPGRAGERLLRSKEIGLRLRAGDVVRLEGAGGGGWGDPANRDVSLIEGDCAWALV
jgi:N-methylhydantoinase B